MTKPDLLSAREAIQEVKILNLTVRDLKKSLKLVEDNTLSAEMIKRTIFQIAHLQPTVPTWTLDPHRKSGSGPGVPNLLLSDWHWGERVDPAQVGGVNSFNLKIAHERAGILVENTIDLLTNHMVNPNYPGLIVALGGDMVSGDIHEELSETNEKPIMWVVSDIYGVLIEVLSALADKFHHLFVPAVTGNHGRTQRKPHYKNRAYTSYDWLIYQLLAKHFEHDKRMTFQISDGPDAYYRVFNHRYLLSHGDQFRGGDGMVGAIGPLCVAPETLILKTDLTYVRADSLQVGDKIVGFDDKPEDHERRKMRNSTVEQINTMELECYEIETDDGQKTIASIDHPWLCRSGDAHAYIKTQHLRIDSRILSLGKPWEREKSWEAGYLAGVLDGEGSLDPTCGRLSIAQQENSCLETTRSILDLWGIPYRISENGAEKRGYEPCYQLHLFNGREEGIRSKIRVDSWSLLGKIRAERIIKEKVEASWEGVSVQVAKETQVIGIRKIGLHPVTAFSTSTHTFIGNGMFMHNTRGDHKKRSRNMEIDQSYDTLVCGHWHQLIQLRRIIVNSSLKGYCEHAHGNNYPFEPPQQALWINHPQRGITFSMPVLLTEKPRSMKTNWVSIGR